MVRIGRAVSTYGLTLAGLCRVAAIRHGRDVVLIDDGGPVTAEQLDRWSATVAGELGNRGIVVSGGKLGVLARSGRGLVVATIAANRLGADAVLLHPAFSATQMAELLRVEELHVVVHDDEFGDLLAAARFRGQSILADTNTPGVISLRSMQALPQATWPTPTRPGRLVVITSGVTGPPRRARRGGAGPAAGLALTTLVRRLELPRGAPMLITPPLHQAFGVQFFALALGLGCPALVTSRFDADRALRLIHEHQVATLVATPTALMAMADALGTEPSPPSLRVVVAGGGSLLANRWRRVVDAFGPIVHHVYGSAETGWCTVAGPADLDASPGSIGRPVAGIDLRIVDDDGRWAPAGAVGRLLVRSPLAALDGAGPRPPGTPEGFVDTGDLARLDDRGRYVVVGRAAERISRGERDVYLDAIEDAVLGHSAVADVSVTAEPAATGTRLIAHLVVRPDRSLDHDEVIRSVRDQLGPESAPDEIRVVTSIATTDTGRRTRVHG